MKKIAAWLLLFNCFIVAGRAQNDMTLLLSDTIGPLISRNIYGQFIEHMGRCLYDGIVRRGKVRMDVVEALRKIKVPILRWPGGCFADQYHWRDGVGPKNQRKKTVNTAWGYVTEDNSFGTDEFMALCRMIGCEPYLGANMGSSTPEELASWVEYLNFAGESDLATQRKSNGHEEPYHVACWGIGNESWGCGGRMLPEQYAWKFRQFAQYCKSYPGTPVRRIAVGPEADNFAWTEQVMSTIQLRYAWGFGMHYYATAARNGEPNSATNFGEKEYFNGIASALKMEEYINKNSAIMDKYDPQKKVALVVDEWGIVSDAEPGTDPDLHYQQNSLRDALVAAATLNMFNNHCDRVRMANLAQAVNVVQSLILTKEDSMLLTPTYYVFDLYKVHQDAHSLVVKFNSPDYAYNGGKVPAINTSASRDSLGVVHLSLVNFDPSRSITVRTSLANLPSRTITGEILTSDKFNDVNTFIQPGKIKPAVFAGAKKQGVELVITLPPKSLVVLELK
jgi:alpha-N-arabinofuranosidase